MWGPFLFFCFLFFFFFFFFKFSGLFWVGSLFVLDKFSFLLILFLLGLSVVFYFCFFKYTNKTGLKNKWLVFLFFSLVIFLAYSFLFLDLLGFYVFFELSLFPLMVLILGWGYQIERVSASFYLFIYTLVGSFPLLVVLLYLKIMGMSSSWLYYYCFNLSLLNKSTFMLVVFFSFFIKLPSYIFHLWLPKAHVEAPGFSSMILAAILLKLGIYAAYRVLPILSSLPMKITVFLILFLLWGAVFSAIICFMQSDLKSLIAYSSISHMGPLMAGLLLLTEISTSGAWAITLGHGFCSAGLFFLANYQFEQSGSRQMLLIRGQSSLFYFMSFFWVLFFFINFAVPPFLNLVGELLLLTSLFSSSWVYFFPLSLLIFLVGAFCVYAFSTLVHGLSSLSKSASGELDIFFLLLVLQGLPLFFFVLNSTIFLL